MTNTEQQDRGQPVLETQHLRGRFVIKSADPNDAEFLCHRLQLQVLRSGTRLQINVARTSLADRLLLRESLACRVHVRAHSHYASSFTDPALITNGSLSQSRQKVSADASRKRKIMRVHLVASSAETIDPLGEHNQPEWVERMSRGRGASAIWTCYPLRSPKEPPERRQGNCCASEATSGSAPCKGLSQSLFRLGHLSPHPAGNP